MPVFDASAGKELTLNFLKHKKSPVRFEHVIQIEAKEAMRTIFLILLTSILFFSKAAYSESVTAGTYNNLMAEEKGKVGKLLHHPIGNNNFLFSLKLNRGKPSYKSGHLYGALQFKDKVAVFESSEFKFKNKICALEFKKEGNVLSIKTVSGNKRCGFGFGVYADSEYTRSSNAVPESYIDALGNVVKFR